MRAVVSRLIINSSLSLGRMTGPFFGTYAPTKYALEAYMQTLRYEVSGFGVGITLLEQRPFGTNLIYIGRPAAHKEIVAEYGELDDVPDAMLNGPKSPDPQMVEVSTWQTPTSNRAFHGGLALIGLAKGAAQKHGRVRRARGPRTIAKDAALCTVTDP